MNQTSPSSPQYLHLAVSDPILDEAWGYWNACRARNRCPSRADIDPLDIPRLLPHVGLADVEDDGRSFRYRLIGTHMNRIFGENYTGRVLDPAHRGAYAAMLQKAYADSVRARRPLLSETEARYRGDRRLHSRRLVLPLANDDGSPVSMLLFATSFRPIGPDGTPTDDYRRLEAPYRTVDLEDLRSLTHVLL